MWGTSDWSIWTNLQSAAKLVSASLFLQMPACEMFRVLVCWHVTVLCLPTSFQAGSSGHRYHHQSQCVSTSCLLLFFIVKMLLPCWTSNMVSSPHHLQHTIVLHSACMVGARQLTAELKGRDVDMCIRSCLSLQICGHGLFEWRLWLGNSVLKIIHMPDAGMSTFYHTVISCGDGFQGVYYCLWPRNILWNIVCTLCLLAIQHMCVCICW
jgi:hypothetical protein